MASFLPPVTFDIDVNAKNFKTGMDGVNNTLKQTSAVADKASKSFGGMTKSAERATSAIKALSLVKALFVAYGVKEILSLQNAYNNLGSALANVGLATDETRKHAQDLSEAYQKLGFDSAAAANGLATLVTATGDLGKSERLLGIAANYARAQHVGLEDASRLVLSASRGNIKVFSQFGITLDTTISKSKALEKAMGELETRLKDRAKNATKDLSVQIQILKQQLMGFVETIAAYVMPWVSKFVTAVINATDWIKQHKDALKVVAFVLSTLVLTAVVNVTRALYAQAAAWVAANWEIAAIVAVVLAAAAAFVYLWNKFKGFRDAVVTYSKLIVNNYANIAKMVLLFAETAVMAFSLAANAFFLFVRGTANAQIALGKLLHNDEMVKRGKETLDWIDAANKNITNFGESLVSARGKIDAFVKDFADKMDSIKDTKIDLSKFKLPKFEIPTFTNGKPIGQGIEDEITSALDAARNDIKRFNQELAVSFQNVATTYKQVISFDYNKEVYSRIGTSKIPSVILQLQEQVIAYTEANNAYTTSKAGLTKVEEAYTAAVKSGNKALIDDTKYALDKAQKATSDALGNMQMGLIDIKKLQQEMAQEAAAAYEEISALEENRQKVLKDAQAERLDLEANYNDEIKKLRSDYDKSVLKAEQEAVKRRAEIVQQSIDLLRNAYRTATYRSIGDIYQALTFEGRYIKGGTTEKILAKLGLQTSKAKTLASDAAQLAGLGFSQTFIEEVVSQGPDIGHKLAQTIIKSTPESIKKMQDYWNELQTTSNHGVDSVAKSLNTGITLATEELTAQLKQVDIDLAVSLKEMAQSLTDSLAEAFDSYSKAIDKINIKTTQQLAEIDKQIDGLRIKLQMFADTNAAVTKGITTPGVVGTPPVVIPQTETTEVEDVATSCPSGRGKYKVVSYKGQEISRTLISCIGDEGTPSTSDVADAQAALSAANAAAADADAAYQESLLALYKSSSIRNQYAERASSAGVGFTQTEIDELTLIKRGAGSRSVTVNITANTNATAQDIANATGWAIRTSGDVQYRAPRGAMPEDRVAL